MFDLVDKILLIKFVEKDLGKSRVFYVGVLLRFSIEFDFMIRFIFYLCL